MIIYYDLTECNAEKDQIDITYQFLDKDIVLNTVQCVNSIPTWKYMEDIKMILQLRDIILLNINKFYIQHRSGVYQYPYRNKDSEEIWGDTYSSTMYIIFYQDWNPNYKKHYNYDELPDLYRNFIYDDKIKHMIIKAIDSEIANYVSK